MAAGLDMHWPGGDQWLEELLPDAEVSEIQEQLVVPLEAEDFKSLDRDLFLAFISPAPSNSPPLSDSSAASSYKEYYYPDESTSSTDSNGSGEKIVGTRKRGRKKGTKNKTRKERQSMQLASHREEKNTKERTRVKNIRDQYNLLREVLGHDSNKKLCKQRVLDSAITYISDLISTLKSRDQQADLDMAQCTTKNDLICKEDALSQSSTSSTNTSTGIAATFPSTLALSPLPLQSASGLKLNFYGQGTLSPGGPFLSSPTPLGLGYGSNQSYLQLASPPLDLNIYRGIATPIDYQYTQFTPPSSYGAEPYPSSPPPPLHHIINMLDN